MKVQMRWQLVRSAEDLDDVRARGGTVNAELGAPSDRKRSRPEPTPRERAAA